MGDDAFWVCRSLRYRRSLTPRSLAKGVTVIAGRLCHYRRRREVLPSRLGECGACMAAVPGVRSSVIKLGSRKDLIFWKMQRHISAC